MLFDCFFAIPFTFPPLSLSTGMSSQLYQRLLFNSGLLFSCGQGLPLHFCVPSLIGIFPA